MWPEATLQAVKKPGHLAGLENSNRSEEESVVGGGETGVGLHAVLTDVQTFGLFLFGDTDAAEEGADDLPGDEAGDHGPDGIGSSTQSLDAELVDAAADQKAEAGAIALSLIHI